ncbi:hypothetical protein [Deinococcus sp.]|uniref:hypothetical protein n=1 Tax=Deinococcus sp. TaxID=47478 RepID=UPI0025BB3F29|nr:hypothetical protein [Deinococcus sp.]
MSLILLPDLGDLLRLQPQFNAGTVVELVRALGSRALGSREGGSQEVVWVSSNDPDHPLRDALPAAGITVRDGLLRDWSWAQRDHEELVGYLGQYPQGRERLQAVAQAEAELSQQLTVPLAPAQLFGNGTDGGLFRAVQDYHQTLREQLDEGPGTLWRAKRLAETVQALAGQQGLVLAPFDDLPALLQHVSGAELPDLTGFSPGEISRLRALADRAWQLHEEDDPNALLESLTRETGDEVTPKAELDTLAAGIYLAAGELGAARELLERAAHGLTDGQPRSLAGLVLARLGQVRDLQGERDLARRTYQAALALQHAAQVVREVAGQGLLTPFVLSPGP